MKGLPPHTREGWLRAVLLVLAVPLLIQGLWARLAPHSFWSEFPTAGRHWVKALGPYDGHLITDVAAGWIALALILLFAAVTLERGLVLAAGAGAAAAGISHFAYHLTTLDAYGTQDNVESMSGLAVQMLLPIVILVLARRPERGT